MNKEFIPYEQALALKELGFNESCFGHYWEKLFYFQTTHYHPTTMPNSPESCLAPLYQQAFRFFREKYDLRIWIESNYGILKFDYLIATTNFNFIDKQFNDLSAYKTYEEAELACLQKLIEITKTK